MKKVIAVMALMLAGCVVLSAAPPAQMRAHIPFAFLAGEHLHPAGDYLLEVNSDFQCISLRSAGSTEVERVSFDGKRVARSGQDRSKGFLRFERYGATYTLHAVGVPEAPAGFGVKPSNAEKELGKANRAVALVEMSLD